MSFGSNNAENEAGTVDISLDRFQRAGILMLVLTIIFSAIGYFASPHDETGKPILLLPEVKQIESFRRSSLQWIEDFHALDSQITTVAANQKEDLFSQSSEAQSTLQLAVKLAQEIDRTSYPPSAVSLHESLASTSLSYLEAARSMMIWVGAPEEPKKVQMNENLSLARKSLETLEKSKWLETR